ncbi:MucBP domain-containing protein [Enterococcus avium]|uniref:MucBP domain-containing protein n=1 Tax=Enterococcus avium TaxID=33945 RepID=UPI0032E41AE5
MRKHYICCLAVLSMIVGVLQFGVAESFAEASTATVTTEYALYDTLTPTEQKNLVTKQPEATITHDEENFRLIYQKKTAQPVNQANKTTGATLQQINTHSVLQSSYKSLPKTGEQKQNKIIVYCGMILLATGILLLVWKRRQAKKALLVLALFGGTGFTSIAAAATPELPAAKTETLAKGSAFKPDTSVSDYDYLGYIHSSNNHESPVVPEKKEGTVLVHFVDENGNTIVPDETLTGNIGEKYTSEAKTINGYSLKEIRGNATGTFTEQQQEVTYVYTKEPVKGANVVVRYVDEEDNTIAPAETLTGNVGEQYKSEAKTITGYILKEVPENATGTFTDQQQEVTYVYTKEPVKGANVVVRYVDEEDNTIAPAETLMGNVGEQYTSEAKTITGYILKEVPENATGTFTEQQQEVTYVYTKEPVKGADVIVHYVDEEGVAIVPDEKLTGNVGEKYTSEAKTITGYILKEVPENATGTFTDQPQEVTYVYEKEKQLGRVIIDFSKVTSNIGRNFYVYIDEEGVPKWTSVKAEGFVLYDTNYRIPDNGKLELEGEVGTKVVGPSGLNLEISGYLPLGLVYLDSEGVEQVAEMQGFRISFNEEAPLTYTEENQTIVYNMYYPN